MPTAELLEPLTEDVATEREPSPLLQEEEPFHPPSDEAMAAAVDEIEVEEPETDPRLTKAMELNARVQKARAEYTEAAEVAKSKKKAYEAYAEGLSDYLASLVEDLPLFDKKPEPEPTIDLPATGWEGVQLRSIDGFPEKAAEKMEEAGITSLLQLANWSKEKRLIDIKGIGEATAEKIEAALAVFWVKWGEKYPEKSNGHSPEGEEARL